MTSPRYVERALFMLGEQDTGKSTQLRSMFLDPRLGNGGRIPRSRNLRNSHSISLERSLYLRLQSPHENGEDMQRFLGKFDGYMSRNSQIRRWNFAGALQIDEHARMPTGSEAIKEFAHRFSPERVRAVILSPACRRQTIDWNILRALTRVLRAIPRCEVMTVDATDENANGLMLADFFDFT